SRFGWRTIMPWLLYRSPLSPPELIFTRSVRQLILPLPLAWNRLVRLRTSAWCALCYSTLVLCRLIPTPLNNWPDRTRALLSDWRRLLNEKKAHCRQLEDVQDIRSDSRVLPRVFDACVWTPAR